MTDPDVPISTPPQPEAPPVKRKRGRPRKHPLPEAKKAQPKNRGADLVPDLEKHRASVATTYWYWIGVLPSCPVGALGLGGEMFPKINENIIRDHSGQQKRVPVIGNIVKLTKPKVDRMRERMSRTVLRFTSAPTGSSGVGAKVGNNIPPRKGYAITIPSDEEIEQRKASKLPARMYYQQEHDEPAARYMFAQLCSDQSSPSRGESYPEVLEKTGLPWPGETTE